MSILLPLVVVSVIVPTAHWAGFALHSEVAVIVPCALNEQRRGLGANEFNARIGEDTDLARRARDHVDVHQLRQLIDVRNRADPSGSRFRWRLPARPRSDRLSAAIWLIALLACVTALEIPSSAFSRKLWMLVGRLVELLRQQLSVAHDRTLRRGIVRAGRERLQRAGEIVVDRFQRVGAARLAIETLQLLIQSARAYRRTKRRNSRCAVAFECIDRVRAGRRPMRTLMLPPAATAIWSRVLRV